MNKGSTTCIFAVIQKCFPHDRGFRLFQKGQKNKMPLGGEIWECVPTGSQSCKEELTALNGTCSWNLTHTVVRMQSKVTAIKWAASA